MISYIERLFIKVLKLLKTDLLVHAHVQIGVGHNTYQSGEEYVIKHVIKKVLNRDPEVIFDVGANIGEYAKILAATFPLAHIYCFEPVPANFANLANNTKGLNTINTLTALGSRSGTLTLHIGANNDDGSMATAYEATLQTFFPFAGEVNQVVETPMTTLDEFCENKIDEIDFLKIDVEGYELEVLKGAIKLIKENRIKIIQFEFGEHNIFSKSFMYDFYQTLKSYTFYRIAPQNKIIPMGAYNPSLEIFRYQNILAIHNTLAI